MTKRLELVYAGKLDQTDFRETAERFAIARGLVGHVKKNANGTMKIVAEGLEKNLKSFLQDFNEDVNIYFDHVSENWLPATGEFTRFSLDHV